MGEPATLGRAVTGINAGRSHAAAGKIMTVADLAVAEAVDTFRFSLGAGAMDIRVIEAVWMAGPAQMTADAMPGCGGATDSGDPAARIGNLPVAFNALGRIVDIDQGMAIQPAGGMMPLAIESRRTAVGTAARRECHCQC
jgi:hypothetical protein